MTRIVYFGFGGGGIQGGAKMTLRHVEALRGLGFDAVYRTPAAQAPAWFDHAARVELSAQVDPDDILVLPEDSDEAIGIAAVQAHRTVIFCQNPFRLAAEGLSALERFPAGAFPAFIAVGPLLADLVRRLYPQATIELVPCFADERVFRPGAARGPRIAYIPRKRAAEAAVIRALFPRLHASQAHRPWLEIKEMHERQVAEALAGSELFLSLSRLESVGMTPLEAMASGCVCAGFTGVGGREYATAENGFWAPDDDCVAAADALAEAAEVVGAGGAALKRLGDAARATAAQWSHARFVRALEETWMRLAPQARLRNGPLD